MPAEQMQVAERSVTCLVEEPEPEPPESFSVALVSHDGRQPPSLGPLQPRVTGNLHAVRPTDDVVVCYSDAPAGDVVALHRLLGRDTPAVLAAARTFDEQDVITAFDHGATSYLVLSQTPEFCLTSVAIITARGESCLSPSAATTLLRHVHRATYADVPEPVPVGELTARERQIMELLVIGHTIKEIAGHLAVTGKTVRNNLSRIYAKLQVRRQSEAILLWLNQPRPVGAGPAESAAPRLHGAAQPLY